LAESSALPVRHDSSRISRAPGRRALAHVEYTAKLRSAGVRAVQFAMTCVGAPVRALASDPAVAGFRRRQPRRKPSIRIARAKMTL